LNRTVCFLFFIVVDISFAQLSYSIDSTSAIMQNTGSTLPSSSPEQSPLLYHTQTSTLTLKNIKITGTRAQQHSFIRWLNGIAETSKGRHTLNAIIQSGHQLHIRHSAHAVLSAGRTIAPMTEDLINGKGASVDIIFDGNMRDRGSHFVYNEKIKLIEFTAQQNLFHELAHAVHQMNGTWRYFDSEAQAIEEENIFRHELATINNETPTKRYGKWGEKISDVEQQYTQR
jgi:hypothetical protein